MIPRLPWDDAEWWASAYTWIDEQLHRKGLVRRASVEAPRIRPWSTVLKVPTDTGDYFFKASAPALSHEPRLVQALSRLRPDCILRPLAIDRERSWMLLPDGGTTLRGTLRTDGDVTAWESILSSLAEFQIEMVEHVREFLDLGVPDCSPKSMPDLFRDLLSDTESLRVGRSDGLHRDEYRRLERCVAEVDAMCRRLEESGIPISLVQEDLHSGNVFVSRGHHIFFDWGDATIAHPFHVLLVALRSVADARNINDGADEILRLRDVYLAPWRKYARDEVLVECFDLAYRLGAIARALTWHRILFAVSPEVRSPYTYAIPSWLKEFLATAP